MENVDLECLNYNPLSKDYYTARQLILPLDYDFIIDKDDPVRLFVEVMEGENLGKYIKKSSDLGRTGYNRFTLLEIILFAFMENIRTLRGIEKACKTDIRFMWLAKNEKPTHTTLANFINNDLNENIERIFIDLNRVIIKKLKIDTSKLYIDGTKIEAYANKYTFVWKKATISFKNKLIAKVNKAIGDLNLFLDQTLQNNIFEIREDYSPEFLCEIIKMLQEYIDKNDIKEVSGKGTRKHQSQRLRDKFQEYYNFMLKYIEIINTCGDNRNSYSKTDKDATFMHLKEDYMRNGQLKPAYNLQIGVSDSYILSLGVFQDRDDVGTFVPFLENYKKQYGFYPKYPVADSGYGSLNNYLYLEQNKMEIYTKYAMYSKEKDSGGSFTDRFQKVDETTLKCPNDKKLKFLYEKVNRKNRKLKDYVYECENCSNCPFEQECKKYAINKDKNRKVSINYEWKKLKLQALKNLTSDLGNQLKINRSIQVEGAFGVIKEDMKYQRLQRRTIKRVEIEFYLVAIAFNLRKYYHNVYPSNILPN